MAVLTPPLSASEVQKAKPAAKDYELFDGQGLTLFVRTTGKKIWRFRYKRPGSTTRTTITLKAITPLCRSPAPALSMLKSWRCWFRGLIPANRPGKQQRRENRH